MKTINYEKSDDMKKDENNKNEILEIRTSNEENNKKNVSASDIKKKECNIGLICYEETGQKFLKNQNVSSEIFINKKKNDINENVLDSNAFDKNKDVSLGDVAKRNEDFVR